MMCEQLGTEPNDDEMPTEVHTLPLEVQEALTIFNILPDKVDGMSGTWFGKDLTSIEFIMQCYEVENPRAVLDFIFIIQREYSEHYKHQKGRK